MPYSLHRIGKQVAPSSYFSLYRTYENFGNAWGIFKPEAVLTHTSINGDVQAPRPQKLVSEASWTPRVSLCFCLVFFVEAPQRPHKKAGARLPKTAYAC